MQPGDRVVTPLGLGRVKWIEFSEPVVRIGVVLDGETDVLVFGPASVWPVDSNELHGRTSCPLSHPIVTEEMCDVLGALVYDNYAPGDQETMYRALDAALAVQPKPQLTEEEREWLEQMRKTPGNRQGFFDIIDRLTGVAR